MISYTIQGKVSSKKNENKFNRLTGRTYKTERFRSWHSSAMWQMRAQPRPKSPISHPVKVSVTFYHGDLRRKDGDNGLSAVMDLLVDAKVLSDDKWIIVRKLEVENVLDRKNPHTDITIEEY